jgi:hypothetical protein
VVTLAYSSTTAISAAITNLSVNVAGSEITGGGALVSNNLTISVP